MIELLQLQHANVILKRWKANKNLELLKSIWDLIDEMQTVDLIKEVKPVKLAYLQLNPDNRLFKTKYSYPDLTDEEQ